MVREGILIKHVRSGAYLTLTVGPGGVSAVNVTPIARDGELFRTDEEARDMIAYLRGPSGMFPECVLEFRAFADWPQPEHAAPHVKTRAQIISEAHAGGAERRASAAAARDHARLQPSGRLFGRYDLRPVTGGGK